MKPLGKKSLNIEADIHREMSIESSRTGKNMYSLLREVWEAHKLTKKKHQANFVPVPEHIKGETLHTLKDYSSLINVVAEITETIEAEGEINLTSAEKLRYYSIRIAHEVRQTAQLVKALGDAFAGLEAVVGDAGGTVAVVQPQPLESAQDAPGEILRSARDTSEEVRRSSRAISAINKRIEGELKKGSGHKKGTDGRLSGGTA